MRTPGHLQHCGATPLGGLVLFVVALLAAGCTGWEGGWIAAPPTSVANSVEPTRIVSSERFGACIARIQVPHWKVQHETRDTRRNGRPGNAGVWEISWNAPEEGNDPERYRVATAIVLPTIAATDQFGSMFPRTPNAAVGVLARSHANVLVLSHDDPLHDPLPEAAVTGLNTCMKKAAVDLGLSCSEAAGMVRKGVSGDDPWCSDFGAAEFSCVSKNICCAIFALYAGGARGEMVIRYGI